MNWLKLIPVVGQVASAVKVLTFGVSDLVRWTVNKVTLGRYMKRKKKINEADSALDWTKLLNNYTRYPY